MDGLSPVLEHEYRFDGTVAAYAWHVAGETFQRGYTLMYDGLARTLPYLRTQLKALIARDL